MAALTQDGAKYSDYMSTLEDEFKNNKMEFIMNRKFPKEAVDMKMVSWKSSSVPFNDFICKEAALEVRMLSVFVPNVEFFLSQV